MARASRAEWAKRVERWKDSGLTAKEFAAETGINPASLNCWSWKLRAEEREARDVTGGAADASAAGPTHLSTAFIELPVARVSQSPLPKQQQSPAVLELLLADDVRVRVPAGFDEVTLRRVVRALGSGR